MGLLTKESLPVEACPANRHPDRPFLQGMLLCVVHVHVEASDAVAKSIPRQSIDFGEL